MKKNLITSILVCSIHLLLAQKPYTAGEIQSKVNVHYGRFEMRMYSSDVSGTTSTFFLWKNGSETNTVKWNEIDIETFGKNPTRWQSNPIWEYNNNDTQIKRWEGFHDGLQIANAWVTFALEWTPNYIAWFNNGVEVRRINKGTNSPLGHLDPVGNISDLMKISFNHWSATSVDWLGPFNGADLPSYQFVDWITYKPLNGAGFGDVSIRHDFNDLKEVTDNYNISTHTFDDNRCDFSTKAVGVTNGLLWLGIFNSGNERAPNANDLPANTPVTASNYWNFTTDLEGWNNLQRISNTSNNGMLNLTVLGSDPYLLSPNNLSIKSGDYKYIVLSMQNNTISNEAQLYWITDTDGTYNTNKVKSFAITPNDNKLRYYIVDLSTTPSWNGNIKQIRLDPTSAGNGDVKIDFIKFVGTDPALPISIPGTVEVEQFNKGGQGNAYNDVEQLNLGGKYRTDEGVDLDVHAAGGYHIGWINPGEWTEYLIDAQKTATYSVDLHKSSPTTGGSISFFLDGEQIGNPVTFPATGSWATFTNTSTSIPISKGKHVLRVLSQSGTYNLNRLVFTESIATELEDERFKNSDRMLFPNPFTDKINISQATKNTRVELIDMNGKVYVDEIASESINTQSLTNGIYFLKIFEESELVKVFKMVKTVD